MTYLYLSSDKMGEGYAGTMAQAVEIMAEADKVIRP